MATTLRRFSDAYGTVTYAVYEPLLLRWRSWLAIQLTARALGVPCRRRRAVR